MRTTLIILFVLLTFDSLFAQNMGGNEKYNLWGEYKINKFYNGSIAAMSNGEAQIWIGKTISFHDSIYFNLNNTTRIKNGFSFSHCKINKEYQVKKIDYERFLKDSKISPKTLGFNSKFLKYISLSTCEISPFSEIYIKDNGNLIVSWDGIYFELSKVER